MGVTKSQLYKKCDTNLYGVTVFQSCPKNYNKIIPNLSISQTVLEYQDFLKTSENCELNTVLKKTIWICQENRHPNLKIVFIMSLMFPLDNATCERIFAHLNIVKTKKRNRLGEQILFDLMLLGWYGGNFESDHPKIAQSIAHTWLNVDKV